MDGHKVKCSVIINKISFVRSDICMNNSGKSTIFLDMTSIRDIGLKNFVNNYFWPVSDNDFHGFVEFINKEYIRLTLRMENDLMFDIAMIELSFFHN